MATGLATRCSACGTVFRVVPDQLRVSEGWVRCGRCSQVFNALEGLVDLETGLPKEAAGGAGQVGAHESTESDFEIARPAARPGSPPLPPAEKAPPVGKQSQPPASKSAQEKTQGWAASDVGSLTSTTALPRQAAADMDAHFSAHRRLDGQPEATPGDSPADKPSFVRSAERAERWRSPRVRAALACTGLLALLALLAQASLAYRDVLAAHLPQTRPWLEQACASLGCQVEAARSIESLAVDSSGLVRVEKSNLYKLQVTLRNRGAIDVAVPALDITLSNSQGGLLARKVLRLSELGASQATIAAGRELAVLATVQAAANGEAALQPIVGYTIELFYP